MAHDELTREERLGEPKLLSGIWPQNASNAKLHARSGPPASARAAARTPFHTSVDGVTRSAFAGRTVKTGPDASSFQAANYPIRRSKNGGWCGTSFVDRK